MSGPRSGIHRRRRPVSAISLGELTAFAGAVEGVRRRELTAGDRVVVSTRNSVYSLTLRRDGAFDVSGGWFARRGLGPTIIRILGCTAGGHALFTELIAAPGLFIEVADGLRTTRVRTVRRFSGQGEGP